MGKNNTAASVNAKAVKRSLLDEFAGWLKGIGYSPKKVEKLLYEPWGDAYPETLLSDDIIIDIEDFLCAMAMFAVEKAFREKIGCGARLRVEVVPHGSYEDCSSVYVLEMETKTVMAVLEEKTWHFNPETIEEDLKDLVDQLEKSKRLLAVRLMADA